MRRTARAAARYRRREGARASSAASPDDQLPRHAADPKGTAIGERIQSGAEDDKLGDAAFDRDGQRILGESRPDRDEHAHPPSGRVRLGVADDRGRLLTQNPHRERVGEDASAFEHLVRGAMGGGCPCRAAGFVRLHHEKCSKP